VRERGPLLFVNPYIEDFAAYDHFMKPYGLLLLAAQFRESHDIYFIDALAHAPFHDQRRLGAGAREERDIHVAAPAPFHDQRDSAGARTLPSWSHDRYAARHAYLRPVSRSASGWVCASVAGSHDRYAACHAYLRCASVAGFNRYCAPLVSEKIPSPPILAGVPRQYRRYGIPADDFIAKTKALPAPPKFIFVTSGMTYWYGGVRHTIALLRDIFPKAKIILGGNYACLLPRHAEAACGADCVIAKKDLPSVMREVLAYIGAEDRPLTHLPAWELLETKAWLPVLTSHGCPYRCSYCAGWRLEPFSTQERTAACALFTHARERYGMRTFAFYDDALLAQSAAHALPLFTELARLCPDIELFTPNGLHARHITRELAEAMRSCGFQDVRLALESSDGAYIRASGAKIAPDEFTRAVGHLFDAGFVPGMIKAYCMAGAPAAASGDGRIFQEGAAMYARDAARLPEGRWEPERNAVPRFLSVESVHQTIEFARRLRVVPMLAWYSPVPGSRDFATLAEHYDLSDPLSHNNTAWIYRVGPGEAAYQELKSHELAARREVCQA